MSEFQDFHRVFYDTALRQYGHKGQRNHNWDMADPQETCVFLDGKHVIAGRHCPHASNDERSPQ